MDKITKAVIPCGGMGTRFLPITKAVPKEILPIIDTPVLAYIVNEAIDSGASDILIVLGEGKDPIRNYFSKNSKLEDSLEKAGKTDFLNMVKNTYSRANISFVVQKQPKGNGDAVYHAKSFTGKDAFFLAWGDDLIISEKPVLGQLETAYSKNGKCVLGVQTWATDDIVKYGVADVEKGEDRIYKCRGIVEKPPLDKIPSRLASLGRYILTPNIFDEIERTKPGVGGEIQITDTLNSMCKTEGVYAFDFVGKRYDMGDKFGSMQATVELALKNSEFGEKFRQYLKTIAATL